jgi:GxxExxY protein
VQIPDQYALTERVIGLAIEVHRHLGSGLLESAYEECLCYELATHDIEFARQVALPIVYKEISLDCGYRMDLVVSRCLVIEIKAIERLIPIHEAQLLTYLRLSGHRIGLLMNFHAILLKDGLRRLVL